MAEVNKLLLREEVPEEYKWHLEEIFTSNEEFEKELAAFKEDMKVLSSFQGRLGESGEILCEYLTKKEELLIRIDSLYAYAAHRQDEDTNNSFYQKLFVKASSAWNTFSEVISFEEPELLSLDEDFISSALETVERLKDYSHYLENVMRQKAHILSKEMEELMALTNDMDQTPYNVFTMLTNADMEFGSVQGKNGEEITITNGRFVPLIMDSDREMREKVFKTFYHSYAQHKNTLAAIYAGNLKKELFNTRARKYGSSMESHLSLNNIPTSVVDGLIEAVHDALPEMYRYVSFRKKMLGLDELHMYDVYAPLVEAENTKYTFEEAKEIVLEGLKPLGEDYIKCLKAGMNSGWIDVYENKGKRSGAYSGGDYAHHPYVLLNFQGGLDDVFTLAHEMGHALHSWYANHTHHYIDANYSIFVAEIASTCNESLLMHHMLKNCKDPKEKLYLLNHYLDTIKGTIYRQTMFAEFEKMTHEMAAKGETLNAETLCHLYKEINGLYFGPEMVNDDEISLEWSRIPHFYSPFYVYQYATGYSAALALSRRILEEGESAVRDYIDFLCAGGSDYPIEVLKKAGVDMTTKAPVASALKVFSEILDQAEAIVEEIEIHK